MSKSNIRLPIDLQTGDFNDVGYDADYIPIKAHPTSEVRFGGNTFPKFNDCCEKALALH